MTSPQFQRKARQHHGGLMTPAQFYAVAQSIRSREPVRTAARLVLVDGMRPVDAARQAGVSSQSCHNTVARVRAAHRMMIDAYCALPGEPPSDRGPPTVRIRPGRITS